MTVWSLIRSKHCIKSKVNISTFLRTIMMTSFPGFSGVTARELCYYFFAPEVRMEWETTLEQATVLEKVAEDTLIFLQLHKRVWPAAQRDALFWSHMRCISSDERSQTWIVCNQSTKHPNAPENQGSCLRVDLTVCFVCDTTVEAPYTWDNAARQHLTTKITYCSGKKVHVLMNI